MGVARHPHAGRRVGAAPVSTLSECLILNRKKGSFSRYDLFVFFVYFFTARHPGGVRLFSEEAARFGVELSAVARRRALATAASVSRGLDKVDVPSFRRAAPWMLNRGDGMDALLRNPAVLFRGARGAAFHLFDLDKTVTVLMQRPLPAGDGLPSGSGAAPLWHPSDRPGKSAAMSRFIAPRSSMREPDIGPGPCCAATTEGGGRSSTRRSMWSST